MQLAHEFYSNEEQSRSYEEATIEEDGEHEELQLVQESRNQNSQR
jgi:hypothetical protein